MSSFKECRHTMSTGQNCKSPAVRGSDFCYFHGKPNQPSRQSNQARTNESPIDFPCILDQEDILIALNQCLQGLASAAISTRRASILLMGIQMAASRVSHLPAALSPAQLASMLGPATSSAEEN